ncbi:MAG: L-aspartate oxidase [Oscillospiraceae bacterium]|jgi:L-aspartate oxidase|nr:L-aspartate oxidase [Oscillospiraceae bacterium]
MTDQIRTDVLIVGSGLAGLYTALHIDKRLSVLFTTKESVDSSSSWLAQGGIAAAIAKDDTPEYHVEDTLLAGAGFCDEAAVRVLAAEGPEDVRRLAEMRVPFDLDAEGELAITREGGHTRNRIVHAGGDATGRETVRALMMLAANRASISFLGGCFITGLLTGENGSVNGALALRGGRKTVISARFVVLATGGLGQIYSNTTNPLAATGDGFALAAKAGAVLRDMEFVQFHPTGLYSAEPSERAFLISEAVRGEGAVLRNKVGERFMTGVHPMADLAPRDIVSRAIVRELKDAPFVSLDATEIPAERLLQRFPTIAAECAARGIDIARDWIPVRPVQHYQVGGVSVNLHAQTTLPGLYAVGEVSCTGVHGANRLASNSMLECLVFGRRAAETMNSEQYPSTNEQLPNTEEQQTTDNRDAGVTAGVYQAKIRRICDEYAGVIRTVSGLTRGLAEIERVLADLPEPHTREWAETRNMALSARAVLSAARARRESAGTHYIEKL